jgi:hypothetical protein
MSLLIRLEDGAGAELEPRGRTVITVEVQEGGSTDLDLEACNELLRGAVVEELLLSGNGVVLSFRGRVGEAGDPPDLFVSQTEGGP